MNCYCFYCETITRRARYFLISPGKIIEECNCRMALQLFFRINVMTLKALSRICWGSGCGNKSSSSNSTFLWPQRFTMNYFLISIICTNCRFDIHVIVNQPKFPFHFILFLKLNTSAKLTKNVSCHWRVFYAYFVR